MPVQDTIHDDLLKGADKIALFLFGDANQRRRVYHLADGSKLPVFRLGNSVCARKSAVLSWIEAQESQATPTAA